MKNKGITLIALVITIIVLLILAGISISMLAGDNSVLQRATEAKQLTDDAAIKEKIKLEMLGSIGTDGNVDIEKLKANLGNIGVTATGNEYPLVVSINGKTYDMDNQGNLKAIVPGLYYAGTDEMIKSWDELLDSNGHEPMLVLDNNGGLAKAVFNVSDVEDKNGDKVGSNKVKLVVDASVTQINYLQGISRTC